MPPPGIVIDRLIVSGFKLLELGKVQRFMTRMLVERRTFAFRAIIESVSPLMYGCTSRGLVAAAHL